jgi:hypothetical protein
MSSLKKILGNADNRAVFNFLKIDPECENDLKNAEDISGFDEGGIVFFEDFAGDLPIDCKWILGGMNNILVNPETGEIFAFQYGRFTFAFRCDFHRNNIKDPGPFQTGETLDARVDLRVLGPCWALLNKFHEDEAEQLNWTYELSLQNNR